MKAKLKAMLERKIEEFAEEAGEDLTGGDYYFPENGAKMMVAGAAAVFDAMAEAAAFAEAQVAPREAG